MDKRVCLAAAFLFPMAAYGSFGGTPCRDFACHFVTLGILVGTVGVPISGLIFAVLHLSLGNLAMSKPRRRFLLGGVFGMVAYEISAACAALMGTWGESTIGYHENYPLIGFIPAYVVSAIVSVLYVRSSPRWT